MATTYKFELSQEGREKLKKQLGLAVANQVERKLKALGFGLGFITQALNGVEIRIPNRIVDQIAGDMGEIAQEKLEALTKEQAITSITVHIDGNHGVMKCYNQAGSLQATYPVTSGKIEPGYADKMAKKVAEIIEIEKSGGKLKVEMPKSWNYTEPDLGPTPPGNYTIHPNEAVNRNEIGKEVTITIPDIDIKELKLIDNNTISIKVDFPEAIGSWIKSIYRDLWHGKVAWGSHLIPLHPENPEKLYGRKGFYIHGGNDPGSAGCVDLGLNMGDFVSKIMLGDPTRSVKVKVSNSRQFSK